MHFGFLLLLQQVHIIQTCTLGLFLTKRLNKLRQICKEFRETFINIHTGEILANEKPRIQVYTNPIDNLKIKLFCWKYKYSASTFMKDATLEKIEKIKKENKKKNYKQLDLGLFGLSEVD